MLERARLSRDPRFDGRFFIAVTSTGIYCRPICPAPSPKRANVRYFPTAAAAAEAGYRPCLRCRPEAAPGTPAWLGTSAVVRRALRLIQEGALDEAAVEQLAERVGIGARHLHRLFVQHVGASPIAVAQTRRLHFAKRLLDETPLSMTQIALASGFGSLRRFNDAFHKTYGRAPRELRKHLDADARPAGARAVARTAELAARNVGAAPRAPSPPAMSAAMPGSEEIRLRLAYRPPYDWAFVSDFLAARAVLGVERVDARGYARTVALPAGPVTIRIRPLPERHQLELTVRGATPAALFALSVTARRMFDLAADPALTMRAFEPDPLLGPLVRQRPGLRIPGVWDPFECAVRAVLGQQVSVAAARTFTGRLVEREGERLGRNSEGFTHLFPTPQQLRRADLSGLGLTGARTAAVRTLAQAVVDGTLDFGASSEQVIAALEALPGLGAWTAHYIALRALDEPDALPAADIILRRQAAGSRQPLSARMLLQRAEAWRPWRGYAVMHLWRAASEQGRRADRATGENHDRDVLA